MPESLNITVYGFRGTGKSALIRTLLYVTSKNEDVGQVGSNGQHGCEDSIRDWPVDDRLIVKESLDEHGTTVLEKFPMGSNFGYAPKTWLERYGLSADKGQRLSFKCTHSLKKREKKKGKTAEPSNDVQLTLCDTKGLQDKEDFARVVAELKGQAKTGKKGLKFSSLFGLLSGSLSEKPHCALFVVDASSFLSTFNKRTGQVQHKW